MSYRYPVRSVQMQEGKASAAILPAPPQPPPPAIYNLGRLERSAKNTGKISQQTSCQKNRRAGEGHVPPRAKSDMPLTKAAVSPSSQRLAE